MARRRGAGATVGTVAGTAVDAAVAGEVGAVATKAAGRVTKRAGRAARKAGAATEQAGENVRRGRGPLTPARARRMIGLGKVVLPLLAPYALASAGVARARWDAYRAARLGVTPSQLNAYSGRGGALHARIDQLAAALDDLDDGAEAHATTAARRFARESRPRLEDLALAVRAAEQMPAAAPQDRAPGGLRRARPDRAGPAGPPGHRPNGLTPGPPRATRRHEQRRVERHRSAAAHDLPPAA